MARPRSELGDIRTSPRNVRILRWLRRKPTPVKVIGETEDGEELVCPVNATGPAQWTDVLGVVRDCVELRAVDKEGSIIRRLPLDRENDPELRAEAETEEAMAHSRKHGGSVSILSVDVPKLVDVIAKNIREVAADSAKSNSGAYEKGFTAMTNVVGVCMKILQGVEQRLARAEDQIENQRLLGSGGDDDDEEEDSRLQMFKMAMEKAGNGSPASQAQLMQLWEFWQKLQQQKPTGDGNVDPS